MTDPKNNITLAQQRKDDHLDMALFLASQSSGSHPFDQIRFVHHSCPEISRNDIKLETEWAGFKHAFPFYINGMTGGSQRTHEVNRDLAILARECHLTMGVGSVATALKDSSVADSYQVVREVNPDGFIFANIGAHHSVENAQRAVDLINADGLQIHLNAPQEAVMPEGDRDFSMWLENIAKIKNQLSVPVVVKEVGFGMSRETIEALVSIGVSTIDVSGRGGTNFVAIENARRVKQEFNLMLNWGQTTPESLLEAFDWTQDPESQVEILASGGVRDFMDIAKALALGAKGVGLAGNVLRMLTQSGLDQTIETVHAWQEALVQVMLVLGCADIASLKKTDLILSGALPEYADQRGIKWNGLAKRHSL